MHIFGIFLINSEYNIKVKDIFEGKKNRVGIYSNNKSDVEKLVMDVYGNCDHDLPHRDGYYPHYHPRINGNRIEYMHFWYSFETTTSTIILGLNGIYEKTI